MLMDLVRLRSRVLRKLGKTMSNDKFFTFLTLTWTFLGFCRKFSYSVLIVVAFSLFSIAICLVFNDVYLVEICNKGGECLV